VQSRRRRTSKTVLRRMVSSNSRRHCIVSTSATHSASGPRGALPGSPLLRTVNATRRPLGDHDTKFNSAPSGSPTNGRSVRSCAHTNTHTHTRACEVRHLRRLRQMIHAWLAANCLSKLHRGDPRRLPFSRAHQ